MRNWLASRTSSKSPERRRKSKAISTDSSRSAASETVVRVASRYEIASSLRTVAVELPTFSTTLCNSSFGTLRCLVQYRTLAATLRIFFKIVHNSLDSRVKRRTAASSSRQDRYRHIWRQSRRLALCKALRSHKGAAPTQRPARRVRLCKSLRACKDVGSRALIERCSKRLVVGKVCNCDPAAERLKVVLFRSRGVVETPFSVGPQCVPSTNNFGPAKTPYGSRHVASVAGAPRACVCLDVLPNYNSCLIAGTVRRILREYKEGAG